jgi:hypothetical protein
VSIALLVAGYVLAVPPLFRLWRIWRNRIWAGYAAETLGALLIAAGWYLRDNTGAVAINGGWAVLFGAAFPLWHLVLQRRR